MRQPLTWREVTAPNFGGVQDSLNSAARLLNGATTGFSQSLGQFGDQGVLQKLAAYTDAQRLQEDMRSGVFNTGNASAEALNKVMARPSALLENAGSQLNNDFRSQLNPLMVEGKTLENNQAALMNPLLIASQDVRNRAGEQSLSQTEQTFDRLKEFGWNNENVDRTKTMVDRSRAETLYQDQQRLGTNTAKAQVSGDLSTEAGANKFYADAVGRGESPTYLQNLSGVLKSAFPTFGVPADVQTGSVSGSAPGVFGSLSKFSPEVNTAITAAETNNKLPTGLLASIVKQETGGKDEYMTDPGKYHYPLNAQGQRLAPNGKVSTAFGPYGIVESTAKDPGYGVKPLQNKTLVEQTRFAGDYIAARIKDAGSVEAGLAGYGEGAAYSASVMKNLNAPSREALRVGGVGAKAQNTMADFQSGSELATRLLRVGAESKGKDNSLSTISASLFGKEGPLNTINRQDGERALAEVQTKLNVPFSVAAELVKEAGSSDWKINLGSGPWVQDKINTDRLQTLIKTYKGNNNLLNSIRTGNVLDENASSVDASLKQVESAQKSLDVAKDQVRKGTPGADRLLAQATTRLDESVMAASNTNNTVSAFAAPNMGTDKPRPRADEVPPPKADKLIKQAVSVDPGDDALKAQYADESQMLNQGSIYAFSPEVQDYIAKIAREDTKKRDSQIEAWKEKELKIAQERSKMYR